MIRPLITIGRGGLWAALTLGVLAPDATAWSADLPWFRRCLVGLEVGPTGAQFGHSDPGDVRYAARFDGAEIVRRTVAAHAEYLVMWVRDGDYAYYNSALLPKAPGLGHRDPLREAVDEARKHRLPVISYCVVQQGGHFLKAHPEWEMRGADGQPIGRFCYNSGYLEAMKQIVAEQLAYGIDGFHIDMLDHGFGPPYGCWCSTCQTDFTRQHGHPMPSGATWDEAWDKMLDFRYHSSDRFEKSLTDHIRSLNPKVTVDFNYHGNPPFSFEVGQRPVQHADNADFVTGETGVWGFSALGVGLNAAFYRASTPGVPFQVAMQRGVRMYHDQTTRPLADLRWELGTLLAHGAFVTMVDKTSFDGALDPVAYDRIGSAFAEARAQRAHFGQSPIADVGLYYSSRSRDWMGRDQPGLWMNSFLGAHKALTYEHLPCGVVLDENASPDTLRAFPVIILPNAGLLSEIELTRLHEYVAGGGQLIITGHTGHMDRLGAPLASPPIESLIGARITGRLESLDNWMRFPAATPGDAGALALTADLPPDWAFLVKGPAFSAAPTTARPLGTLLKPHRTTRQKEGREGTDWPMSPDAPVGPAILLHEVGQGRVLTFTGSPDWATASEHHLVETRRLIAKAVRFLHPCPRVRVEAPPTVQSVVTDDPATRTLRVHFLGYNSPPQTTPATNRPLVLPAMIETAPMFRASVRLANPPLEVTTVSGSSTLKHADRRIDLLIEAVHEILVIRY